MGEDGFSGMSRLGGEGYAVRKRDGCFVWSGTRAFGSISAGYRALCSAIVSFPLGLWR